MASKSVMEVLRLCRSFSSLRLQPLASISSIASHPTSSYQPKCMAARHFSLQPCVCARKRVQTHQLQPRKPVHFNYSALDRIRSPRILQLVAGRDLTYKFGSCIPTGDLVAQPALSPEAPHYSVRESGVFQNAPEEVKKLFTLGYVTGGDKKEHRKEEMMDRIRYLFGPHCDKELKVATMTVTIRNMVPHCLTFQKEKRGKVMLIETIQARKKLLKQLRSEDYERFFWLLRELRIKYVPYPQYPRYIGKRKRTRMAAIQELLDTRRDKLQTLQAQLEAEREQFEAEKARVLAEIDADIKEFDLDKEQLFKVLERKPVRKEEPVIIVRSHLVKGSEEAQAHLQQQS